MRQIRGTQPVVACCNEKTPRREKRKKKKKQEQGKSALVHKRETFTARVKKGPCLYGEMTKMLKNERSCKNMLSRLHTGVRLREERFEATLRHIASGAAKKKRGGKEELCTTPLAGQKLFRNGEKTAV